ncbi:ABC transporter permease [Leifsonia xyli subsp. cynodontis DSM 46306]|uniref:Uncharacterized protein n=1 Tax=Leifsonia xyli subsp. cynodontis DSM 46306 TaxID=1389489 RepID=U3P7R6_LEIXC|nr:ABC transporter permease [Leifsonia xyli subsp. cynodontis DSM 46306]
MFSLSQITGYCQIDPVLFTYIVCDSLQEIGLPLMPTWISHDMVRFRLLVLPVSEHPVFVT